MQDIFQLLLEKILETGLCSELYIASSINMIDLNTTMKNLLVEVLVNTK